MKEKDEPITKKIKILDWLFDKQDINFGLSMRIYYLYKLQLSFKLHKL
jgi:hypothetical protein